MLDHPPTYKMAFLGGEMVGKTALILQICFNFFESNYESTIQDSYCKELLIKQKKLPIHVVDTGGNENLYKLRNEAIKSSHLLFVVYDITSFPSFKTARELLQTIPRIKKLHHNGKSRYSVVLLGNKMDQMARRQVQVHEGAELAARFACSFYECSAMSSPELIRSIVQKLMIIEANRPKGRRASMVQFELKIKGSKWQENWLFQWFRDFNRSWKERYKTAVISPTDRNISEPATTCKCNPQER